MKRLLFAFLVAPIVPAIAQAWISSLSSGHYHPLAVFIVICGAFYLLQLVVGLPSYLILRQTKRHRLWVYALIGFCAAAVPLFSWTLYKCGPSGCNAVESAWYSANFGLLSAVAATIFWLIARPDKAAKGTVPPASCLN